ncbi:hypothetical protein GA0070615_6314 [Micromonospora aurantiaca]|nr:hypothetical protein GA0070615_6314 [Micromonospora aurantiaca]
MGWMSTTRGWPSVRVPVLSNATRSGSARCSITTADLTRTPWRPARAIADSSGGIVARTTAHGDATIMNVIDRNSVERRSAPKSRGTANSARVATTTAIEYRCSTFSMNSCVLALVADACSTRATMRAITDSPASRCTRTTSVPVPLRVPANTSSPTDLPAGSGSPVMVASSTSLMPSTTTASAPMRTPGRTRTWSPKRSSTVSTTVSPPSGSTRVACSGCGSGSGPPWPSSPPAARPCTPGSADAGPEGQTIPSCSRNGRAAAGRIGSPR